MEVIAEECWSWMLLREGDCLFLSVLCGTSAIYSIDVQLSPEEALIVDSDVHGGAAALAAAVRQQPTHFARRRLPAFDARPGVSQAIHAWRNAPSQQSDDCLKKASSSATCHADIVDLYERHAHDFDRDRSRSLQERMWLDRFLAHVRPGGTILDIGCGMAEPMARYIIGAGFPVVGVDASPSMINLCWSRFPGAEWIVGDMRTLALERTFDGVLAWDSVFHLNPDDQRAMFRRFAEHARPGAPLMFTSGPAHGEVIGSYCGEPLYHASLDPAEYEERLSAHGFSVLAYVADDPECGAHTVWLVRYGLTVADAAVDAR